jgi:PKD repeat protein
MKLRVLFVIAAALLIGSTSGFGQTVPQSFFSNQWHQQADYPLFPVGGLRLVAGINWASMETSNGTYDWSGFDSWVNYTQSHNIDLMFTLLDTPSWASSNPNATCYDGPGQCAPPTNIQDWDNYVTAVVSHAAGRVKIWEVWNEPEDPQYWTGTTSQLVTMAQHAYNIIKSIDPTATVLTPPPSRYGSLLPGDWMRSYLAAGGGQYADVIGFHGYTWGNFIPEDINGFVDGMRSAMSSYGQSTKPLWDTEGGWTTDSNYPDADAQAAWVARYYLLQWSKGVSRFYWYAYDNSGWGTLWSPTSGLLKPGIAYREVEKWMVGATLTAPCAQDSAGNWTCSFSRGGSYQALAIWNANATQTYTAPTQYRQYRDLSGGVYTIPSTGAVSVGAKPILLETNTAGSDAPPTAVLAVTPQQGYAPLQVSASGNGSTDSDGSIVSWSLSFGDGYVVNSSTAAHTYTVPGTYTVTLTVVDNAGLSSTATQMVSVTAAPPSGTPCSVSSVNRTITICSPSNSATVSSPVQVVAQATDASSVKYMQVYVDGVKVVQAPHTTTINSAIAISTGTHQLTVQAKDAAGVFQSSLTITVQ